MRELAKQEINYPYMKLVMLQIEIEKKRRVSSALSSLKELTSIDVAEEAEG
jgi:hypothetical protein